MSLPSDYPPPFINPSVIIYGALADAFRTPMPRPPDYNDHGLSPDAANSYEALFERGVNDLIEADEMRYQTAFSYDYAQLFGLSMGANWEQAHSIDAVLGLE